MLQPAVHGKFTRRAAKKQVVANPEDIFNGLHHIPDLLEQLKKDAETRKKEHEDGMRRLEEAIANAKKIQRGPKGDKGDTPIVGVHFSDPKDVNELAIEERVYDRVSQKLRQPRDGKDAEVDYKKLARMVARRMPKTKDIMGKPHSIKDIITALKNLPEEERLTIDDLGDSEARIKKFWERYPKGYLHGGGDHVVAGSGVMITTNKSGQKVISAAGSAISIIVVSGTINDSNMNFSAATEPTLLCINGAFYTQTGGNITWTYSGGNITLSTPVGTNGSIFGI